MLASLLRKRPLRCSVSPCEILLSGRGGAGGLLEVLFDEGVDRAVVVDGKVEARPIVTVTLSADHRATDGHRGGLFLMAIDRLLQHPETL